MSPRIKNFSETTLLWSETTNDVNNINHFILIITSPTHVGL